MIIRITKVSQQIRWIVARANLLTDKLIKTCRNACTYNLDRKNLSVVPVRNIARIRCARSFVSREHDVSDLFRRTKYIQFSREYLAIEKQPLESKKFKASERCRGEENLFEYVSLRARNTSADVIRYARPIKRNSNGHGMVIGEQD